MALFDPLGSLNAGYDFGEKLKFSKKERESKYLQGLADLEMKQAEATNAPAYQKGKADLINNQAGLTGLTAKYYPQDIMSQIGLRGAQTNSVNKETSYLPLKYAIEATNSTQKNERFGQAYQLSVALKNMDPATRATWISQHPDEYTEMVNGLADKASQKESGDNGLVSQLLPKYFPQYQAPQQVQQQIPQGQQQQNPAGGLMSPMQQSIPQSNNGMATPVRNFTSTPEQIAQLKRTSEMAANKDLTTAATRRQMEAAIQVENIVNDPELQYKAQNAAQYAGAARKGNAALAALSQRNPQAYEDYISFKNQDMVLLSNRIKTMDQMGATDAQRDELNGLYAKTMDSLLSNPEQFITQFNNLGKSLDRVAKSVQKSANPVVNNDRLAGFNPIGEKPSGSNSPYSSMSTDDIKRRIAELQGGK